MTASLTLPALTPSATAEETPTPTPQADVVTPIPTATATATPKVSETPVTATPTATASVPSTDSTATTGSASKTESPAAGGDLVAAQTDTPVVFGIVGPEPSTQRYVSWNLRNGTAPTSPLVGGGTFELQYGGTGTTASWVNPVYVVVDCVAADASACTGYDKDPDAGEFQVPHGATGPNGNISIPANARPHMRVRPSASATTWQWNGLPWSFVSSTSTWVNGRFANNTADSLSLNNFQAGTAYITWDVRADTSESSALIGGATFNLRNNAVAGTIYPVPDCVEAPCIGYDSDPAPGVFRVANGATDADGANPIAIASGQQWRFQPAAPGFWEMNGKIYQFTTLTTSSWYPASNHTWTTADGVSRSDLGNVAASQINTAGTMTVTVRKRVLANPSSLSGTVASNIGTDYSYTAGARFRLYTNVNGEPGQPVTASWASCEVASGGQCNILIPGASGGLAGQRFWVVEEAPAPGSDAANTYSNDRLYVGNYENPQYLRRLVGLTNAVSATTIYMPMTDSTASITGGTAITTAELPNSNARVVEAGSFGAVANSYKNPAIEPKCAPAYPNIAVVIDGSSSISQTDWTTFRAALVGTGSDSVLGVVQDKARVSILTFGPSASWNYGSTGPVLVTSANRTAIAGTVPTNRPALAGTNWDAALSTIQSVNASHDYDLVLFVTDGAPNAILGGVGTNGTIVTGTSGTGGYQVALRALEAPTYAANTLKSSGVRVVAVGVGDGANTDQVAANLRSISGETKNKDYFQGAWTQLNAMLADVVKAATCTVPIEVSKTTVEGASTVANAGGWNFSSSRTGDGTLTSPTPSNGTTTAGGSVKWDLNFSSPGHSADLTLTENPTPAQTGAGWALTGVSCTVDGVNRPVTVVNGSVKIAGLGPASGKVSCVFTNTKTQAGALSIEKKFENVPAGAGNVPFSGTYACEVGGASVSTGTWSRTSTGAATITTTSGSAYDKLPVGASCSVEETAIGGQPLEQNSQGLPNSSWIWAAPAYTPDSVTISADQTANLVVTNTPERVYGNFSVTKVVPEGSVVSEDMTFGGDWSCTPVGETAPVTGSWGPIGPGETWASTVADEIPLGATCAVTSELREEYPVEDHSHQWDGDPVFSDPVEAKAGEGVQLGVVTVTNTTKAAYGNFSITKVVDGTADAANTYSGEWQCTLGTGETAVTVDGTWGAIAANATWTSTDADMIPVGAICAVTSETRPDHPVADDHSHQWDGAPAYSDPVEAKAGEGVQLGLVTVTNKTKRQLGSVIWTKVDEGGTLLKGSEWELKGPGANGPTVPLTDCVANAASECTGPDKDPAAGTFLLEDLVWGEYQLTETKAPAGFIRDTTVRPFTIGSVDPAKLEWNLGAVENRQIPGVTIPLTGGLGRDAFFIAGLGVLALGLGTIATARIRNRKEAA